MERLKIYKKDLDYSYTLGPFPTFEIIKYRPDLIIRVILSEEFNEKEKMIRLLEEKNIDYTFEEKTLERIGNRKKIFAAAVFKKDHATIEEGNHLLLEEVRDMGNLGMIMRSMAAFGFKDLVLLGNSCDLYHPKVVRGSMGSFFTIRVSHYPHLQAYKRDWEKQKQYAFLLNPESKKVDEVDFIEPFTLCFGNEGAGLTDDFLTEDIQPVFISQTEEVDSLNLTLACGIGMYESRRGNV